MQDLTPREHYHAVMTRKPGVRTLLWEFGYWMGTVERWYGEGLRRSPYSPPPGFPAGAGFLGEALPFPHNPGVFRYRDLDVHRTLGFDEGAVRIPLVWRHCPAFTERILEETETTRLLVNSDGVTLRVSKASDTLPQELDWPVLDRASWEKVKEERFGLDVMPRLPDHWERLAATYWGHDYPLGLVMDGFFSTPRELIGVERQLMMYYDDPELMHDVNDRLATIWLAMLEEVVARVDLDFVYIWEDMAYKTGPLVSPRMFAEFLTPYYRRITGFLQQHGVNCIFVDTDGNCWGLIPEFLKAGVTGLYPFEVNAGMDIVEVRKQYPDLLILGGLDKIKMAESKPAIDAELETKLPFMLAHGGYVPFCDHLVPPDVSWENFRYYRERIQEYAERCQPGGVARATA